MFYPLHLYKYLRSPLSLLKYLKHYLYIRSFQNKLLKSKFKSDINDLIIFLTPGRDIVNGGILSITSIYEETKKLKNLHNSNIIMCTIPGDPLLLKYTKFKNNNYVFGFSQVLSHFNNINNLIIHIPEYCIHRFLRYIKYNENIKLLNMENMHFNIMLQNIELLSPIKYIYELKKMGKVTCTTAHEKYSSLKFLKKLGISIHKLSWYLSPENYNKIKYDKKNDLLIVSPDHHIKKRVILNLIMKSFPKLKVKIIQNLTYEQYKKLIEKAKWSLTFGEGLDGYFIENIFSGGISFAVYNPSFFTKDFKSLLTIYDNYDILYENIITDIKNFNEEKKYAKYQQEQYDLICKYFNYDEYVENIKLFYEGKYTHK